MKLKAKRRTLFAASILMLAFTLISCSQSGTIWRKGKMHTHSFWSDGDDFPESVARWYKENGYDFLALTDHNVILKGERWRSIPNDHPALQKYRETYGSDWVETQPAEEEGHTKVRLKTLQEFRSLYEEPGEFIGTMQGFDSASTPTTDAEGKEIPNTTKTYSPEIGRVLAESQSLNPVYTFTGRELYVRVRITSTADHINPTTGEILGKQKAWLQPNIPRH